MFNIEQSETIHHMFDIAIQSAFTHSPVTYTNCNAEKAITLYRAIDWAGIYRQIEESGSSPESPFYYYEINRRNQLGEKETLCISGGIRELVGIAYQRPKMERKGFFRKKDVLNPEYLTQMEGMDADFAFSCLQAFIKGDTGFLEQNMYDKEEN
jgi:hypothetical protein